jgi:hypothetical protein
MRCLPVLSRRGARMRSRHNLSAVVSPSNAIAIALRVDFSLSPSRSTSAARVALWREPVGHPFGFPERPLRNRPPALALYCQAERSSVAPQPYAENARDGEPSLISDGVTSEAPYRDRGGSRAARSASAGTSQQPSPERGNGK